MIEKPKTRPHVLLPAGPFGWASHTDILPMLMRVWQEMGLEICRVWMPRPQLSQAFADRLRKRASALIFPLGLAHYDGLWTLSVLRRKFGLQMPAVIMITSDLTKGYQGLFEHLGALTEHDVFICNCQAEAQILRRCLGAQAKVHVIALPVSEHLFYADQDLREKKRLQLSLKSSTPMLLYAGRISVQKNVHSLIWTFAQLRRRRPHAQLYILGEVDDIGVPHFPRPENQMQQRYLHHLSNLIVQYRLANCVHFPGRVNHVELNEYFNACDLQVSLSLHSAEDFGYSVAQGMQAGAPTLLSRWGGHLDHVASRGAIGTPVHWSQVGPQLNLHFAAQECSRILEKSATKHLQRNSASARQYLGIDAVKVEWQRIVQMTLQKKSPSRNKKNHLQIADDFLKHYIDAQMLRHNGKGFEPQFTSPHDPLYKKIFSAYAGSKDAIISDTRRKTLQWHPFFNQKTLQMDDPLAATLVPGLSSAQRSWLNRITKKSKNSKTIAALSGRQGDVSWILQSGFLAEGDT